MFRALNHRNYRLFFVGQTISLIGSWMDTIAMSWLVLQLTNSTVLLGTVLLFNQVPAFFISPFAGVWIDQLDRRRLLVVTQSISGAVAFLTAYLVFTGLIQVWEIMALSLILGLVSAFDMPGRQTFMIEIVTNREDLSNAIALNSSQFNIARLIGPPMAGMVIHLVGIATCFLINAISFFAVIGALLAMKVPRFRRDVGDKKIFQHMKEGWSYITGFTPIWVLLVLLAAMSFSSGMYYVLMPVYAKNVFLGDERTYGFLSGAVGIGALSGALLLATRKNVIGLGKLIVVSTGVYGLAMVAFGLNHSYVIALVLLAFVGFGVMVNMAATNTLLQSLLDDSMRGRVMAFYSMSFLGSMPIGSFLSGTLAPVIGLSGVIWIAGGIGIVSSFLFSRVLPNIRIQARSVLTEKGLYPTAQPAISPGQGQ